MCADGCELDGLWRLFHSIYKYQIIMLSYLKRIQFYMSIISQFLKVKFCPSSFYIAFHFSPPPPKSSSSREIASYTSLNLEFVLNPYRSPPHHDGAPGNGSSLIVTFDRKASSSDLK